MIWFWLLVAAVSVYVVTGISRRSEDPAANDKVLWVLAAVFLALVVSVLWGSRS